MLRAYMKKYGVTGENLDKLNVALAQVAVKNHANAIKNEYAQYQREITVDQVFGAREAVQKPLGLYDFAPVSDGASALILTSEECAKKLTDKPVYVVGYSSATDYLSFPARDDLTHFAATKIAMKNALSMTGKTPWDMHIVEVYDQSTVMELVSLEDLGFCESGTAWKSINESCNNYKGYYEIDGKRLFVNMNGGLKADGNPLGATGGAEIFEVFRQLRGEAGERQVEIDQSSPLGCTLEFEGFGTKAYVTILGRGDHE
jgi:acetyl-CoA C-acetyltransferase